VAVGPADEDAASAQYVDQRRLRGFGRRLRRRALALLARAGATDVPVREDAVVTVAPLDAERVATHLRELVDSNPV
jgi:hypothetical protein